MRKPNKQHLSIGEVSVYLGLLTFFLVLLELSYFIQCNKAYLSDFTFVSNHIAIPSSILPGFVYFMLAQLLVHVLLVVVLLACVVTLFRCSESAADHGLVVLIGVWICAVMTIVAANQLYYPNSKFVELSSLFLVSPWMTKAFFYGFVILDFLVLVVATCYWIKRAPVVSVVAGILSAAVFGMQAQHKDYMSVASKYRPNIIVVGVDSLRPDYLGYFGGARSTPFIDEFLSHSVSFNRAITPLARTFPSWVSMLTGQYPVHHSVRFNLADASRVDVRSTLPSVLRNNGYETIYATDETRFSNIDKNFGFDSLVSPPMGLNDFLLGTFNDFPLTNLLINTRVGQILFPYSYANRPVYFTYKPSSFISRLRSSLLHEHSKPLFLAVHFCLPHFPYLWADLNGNDHKIIDRYQYSVQQVDKQLADFFNVLHEAGLMEHAIVVLLSDHGEALELPGDRVTSAQAYLQTDNENPPKFYPPSLDDEAINQSAGHGTDVLGLGQYHSLLAFRVYGDSRIKPRSISDQVSLLDMKPTILSMLGLSKNSGDGESLRSILLGQRSVAKDRHFFIESDYTPEAIRTIYPETRKAMLEGIDLFRIDPESTRLVVRDEMGGMIINSKQYADLYQDWVLALYPQDKDSYMPILVNLTSGLWTNHLNSAFAQHSPAGIMLSKMETFYQKSFHLLR